MNISLGKNTLASVGAFVLISGSAFGQGGYTSDTRSQDRGTPATPPPVAVQPNAFPNPTGRVALRRGDVIPVTFDRELSIAGNQEGDRFSTTVRDSSYLPNGSHIDGYIKRITAKVDDRPASMELAFDRIILPDGSRTNVSAVPMPLDDKYVQRNPDGRYVAKQTMSRGSTVGIGALGGLVLGALAHRPFEGAFLGTLAGIVVAETNKDGQNLTIKAGTVAGAAIQRDVSLQVSASSGARVNPQNSSAYDIRVGLRVLIFKDGEMPYDDRGVTMVPLKSAATQLGYTIDFTPNAIFIEDADHSLRLEFDSSNYRYDGRRGDFARPVVKRDGTYYGPIDVLVKMSRDDVMVNGTKVAKPA